MIAEQIRPKLSKLIPRLSSDSDGEVVATVRAIDRTLKAAGLSFHDLTAAVVGESALALQSSESAKIAFCKKQADDLSAREKDFLETIGPLIEAGYSLSPRQARWLNYIFLRLKEGVHGHTHNPKEEER